MVVVVVVVVVVATQIKKSVKLPAKERVKKCHKAPQFSRIVRGWEIPLFAKKQMQINCQLGLQANLKAGREI